MQTFPTLKTGAVAQYPASRRVEYQNQAVRFVDGTEQRYRDSGGPRRRWEIALRLLDEGELAAIEEFFGAAGGTFNKFAFVDPWDGVEYADCSLAEDALEIAATGEMRGGATLIVVENRT
jgi:uncharacterized protein DUF2460